MLERNIAVVWDFDGTLIPEDSTSQTIDILLGDGSRDEFWDFIKKVTEMKRRPEWEHILRSHAPAWMYALSRIAFDKGIPLNSEFFKKFVVPYIEPFPNALKFLSSIKRLEDREDFKAVNLRVNHFIISAGLKELVEQVFPKEIIKYTFGCRYTVIAWEEAKEKPESIPVFCMDESMKTRSLFEISKGVFDDPDGHVNEKKADENLWAPFQNIIYIGDGYTDVPALSLTRYRGGMGIVVYNPSLSEKAKKKKLSKLSLDRRADLITAADFSLKSELHEFIEARCIQIKQRYEAENFK